VREFRPPGSVRGACGDARPYRDRHRGPEKTSKRKSINDRVEMRPRVLASLGLGVSVVKILRSFRQWGDAMSPPMRITQRCNAQAVVHPNQSGHPLHFDKCLFIRDLIWRGWSDRRPGILILNGEAVPTAELSLRGAKRRACSFFPWTRVMSTFDSITTQCGRLTQFLAENDYLPDSFLTNNTESICFFDLMTGPTWQSPSIRPRIVKIAASLPLLAMMKGRGHTKSLAAK
jgi:hypothetical protein